MLRRLPFPRSFQAGATSCPLLRPLPGPAQMGLGPPRLYPNGVRPQFRHPPALSLDPYFPAAAIPASSLDPGWRPAYLRSARDVLEPAPCPIKVPNPSAALRRGWPMTVPPARSTRTPGSRPSCAGTSCVVSSSSAPAPMAHRPLTIGAGRRWMNRPTASASNADLPNSTTADEKFAGSRDQGFACSPREAVRLISFQCLATRLGKESHS